MGKKRAYKHRKPGGGRKKLKPEYDAGENLKEQMDAAVTLYEEDCSLRSIADALTLNPIKVRKLLITAGVYESEVAEKVLDIFEEYRETQDYKICDEYAEKDTRIRVLHKKMVVSLRAKIATLAPSARDLSTTFTH